MINQWLYLINDGVYYFDLSHKRRIRRNKHEAQRFDISFYAGANYHVSSEHTKFGGAQEPAPNDPFPEFTDPENPSMPGDVDLQALQSLQVEQTSAVNQVDPATLTCADVIDFNELEIRNYNTLINLDGAVFGKGFIGQYLTYDDEFDILTGTPLNPLRLWVGLANQNLAIGEDDIRVLAGLGHVDVPPEMAVGEGVIAVLFDNDQYEIGFQIVGADGGDVTVNFFRRDGSLIDTVVFTSDWDDFAFRRDDNIADIAGITIHNTDPGGIGFDNFVMCHPLFSDYTEALQEYILDLPDDAFDLNPEQRKNALYNKLAAISNFAEDCKHDVAVNKLVNDIRAKTDAACAGGDPNSDWIVDPEAQVEICQIIDEALTWLEQNPCPLYCSEAAIQFCEGRGWYVMLGPEATGGSIVCTVDGRSAERNCDGCGQYNIVVWESGIGDYFCPLAEPYSTYAGHVYCGHQPCECGDNLVWCGLWTWDLQGCIPDP